MTEQQQREACAQLARRMGITIEKRWQHVTDSSWCLYDLRLPGGTYLGAHCGSIEEAHALLPDYFNSPVASRELIVWLVAQPEQLRAQFERQIWILLSKDGSTKHGVTEVLFWIGLPLPVIARAACKALGIEVSE
jgi:hypothetical protein